MLSKVIVYLVVCYLQFFLIMAMGIYLFPLLNLPALIIDGRLGTLSLLAVTVALAAIGYGIAIGTIARTHQQASIFASISVVILAAIGGIWVPIFMMPPLFRHVSQVSPLNWGLNGFYDILIRGAGIRDILPDMLLPVDFYCGLSAALPVLSQAQKGYYLTAVTGKAHVRLKIRMTPVFIPK